MESSVKVDALTCRVEASLIEAMRFFVALCGLILGASGLIRAMEEPRLVTKVTLLPVALDRDFEIRKTKLYLLSEKAPGQSERTDETGQNVGKGGKLGNTAPSSKSTTVQDTSITFERKYRLFGAVTKLDQHQRFGNYFDFFWRAKRTADLTVRLEYRQEKLHAHVQGQQISYANVHGNHKTEFRVVGDDYFDDGRVIAWRCLLIENGKIVAETHSYTWE
jgi:hypothetical protein